MAGKVGSVTKGARPRDKGLKWPRQPMGCVRTSNELRHHWQLAVLPGRASNIAGTPGSQGLGTSASIWTHMGLDAHPLRHNSMSVYYMSVYATKAWKRTHKLFKVFLSKVGNWVYTSFIYSRFTKFSTMSSHCKYSQKNYSTCVRVYMQLDCTYTTQTCTHC